MIFYKTSSFGNDFIEIDRSELTCLQGRGAGKGNLAREICDRQRGVGADGVVYFLAGKRKTEFQVFNRDGGEAELSGNGMAGLAAVLLQRRLAASPLTLQSVSGTRRARLLSRRGPRFELLVEIGAPDFSRRDFFPFLDDKRESYAVEGLEFHPVSVGNPHAVVLCQGLPPGPELAALGKKLEGHPMFPRRVNVEFVHELRAGSGCRVFFYERGVGPTQASSTGSAAVFAVLRRLGKAGDRLDIDLGPAGGGGETIELSWHDGIFIRNLTRIVCRGDYFA